MIGGLPSFVICFGQLDHLPVITSIHIDDVNHVSEMSVNVQNDLATIGHLSDVRLHLNIYIITSIPLLMPRQGMALLIIDLCRDR